MAAFHPASFPLPEPYDLLRSAWAKTPRTKEDKEIVARTFDGALATAAHPLVCHSIDTAEVAYRLYPVVLGPEVRRQIEVGFAALGDPRSWVAFLCGLHDLGKLTPVFQQKSITTARYRWQGEELADIELARCSTDVPHGRITAFHLRQSWLGPVDAYAANTFVHAVTDVLGGHHGWFPSPGTVRNCSGDGLARDGASGSQQWKSARDTLVRELARIWGVSPETADWANARMSVCAAVGFAALTTLSDWLASDASRFSFEPDPFAADPDPSVALDAYRRTSAAKADAALRDLDLKNWEPPASGRYEDLFAEARDEPARPLHTVVERLLSDCEEPGVLVIDAPTGEGKTRAGLLAAATLARRLAFGGMYLAQPTQTLSRQTRTEVQKFLQHNGSALRAHLVFAGSVYDPEDGSVVPTDDGADDGSGDVTVEPADVCDDENPVGDPSSQEEPESPHIWYRRKKGLAYPVGVGTFDQGAQGVIRSGHMYVRLGALSNKVLVIDEVHSYDSYTSALFDILMWWTGCLGIPVVLMSATLTAERRDAMVAAWQRGRNGRTATDASDAVAAKSTDATLGDRSRRGTGHWRASWHTADGAQAVEQFSPSEPFKRSESRGPEESSGTSTPGGQSAADRKRPTSTLRVTHMPDDFPTVVEAVLERLSGGGAALVICNTVQRATDLHEAFRRRLPSGVGLTLVHGKMKDSDGNVTGVARKAEEDRIVAAIGKESRLEDRFHIVVGTQVLEHGLDIDADLLVSDVCPVDLLLQRIGRLFRHWRRRPKAIEGPELLLVDTPYSEVIQHVEKGRSRRKSMKFSRYVSTIYAPAILGATREVLRDVSEIDVLRESADLVHNVYVEPAMPDDPALKEAMSEWIEYERARREDDAIDAAKRAVPELTDIRELHHLTYRSGPPPQVRKRRRPDDEPS